MCYTIHFELERKLNRMTLKWEVEYDIKYLLLSISMISININVVKWMTIMICVLLFMDGRRFIEQQIPLEIPC